MRVLKLHSDMRGGPFSLFTPIGGAAASIKELSTHRPLFARSYQNKREREERPAGGKIYVVSQILHQSTDTDDDEDP